MWERYAIAAPGNWVWAYGLIANFKPGPQETWVDYSRTRARAAALHRRQRRPHHAAIGEQVQREALGEPSLTEYHEFDGRSHWICAEPGWEEVADYALEWALAHAEPSRVTTA